MWLIFCIVAVVIVLSVILVVVALRACCKFREVGSNILSWHVKWVLLEFLTTIVLYLE